MFTLQFCNVQCLLFLSCRFPPELTEVLLYRLNCTFWNILFVYVTIARDNLVFLKNWFLKFPQYRNRSLFITGESYAGKFCCSKIFSSLLIEIDSIKIWTYLLLLSITRPLYTSTGWSYAWVQQEGEVV